MLVFAGQENGNQALLNGSLDSDDTDGTEYGV
jgi:hypothetical protein